MRPGLPARRDPHEGLRAGAPRGRPRGVPHQGLPRQGTARPQADHPALARRLHRLRRVRQRLPREEQDRGEAPRHQHGARGGAPRRGARQLAVLRHDPAAGPRPPAARHGQGFAGARTALRVLRGLRGLRRDALRQARLAALRRPHRDRQLDRLLVDLRRQPADDAVDRRPRRARTGVEQLAVRGHRRVRDGHAHGLGGARSREPGCSSSASPRGSTAPSSRRSSRPLRTASRQVSDEQRSEGRRPRAGAEAPRRRRPRRPAPAGAGRRPRDQGRLDHRRRRLGLRHRFRRPRPRARLGAATSTSWCWTRRSTPTPAGRRPRRRPAARWPSSPPRASRNAKKDLGALAMAYGTAYVAQIALGANDAQAIKALLEADAWPGPSLVIAYCTCTAHGMDMSRSMDHHEGRGAQRVLAAVPLPAHAHRRRPAVHARLAQALAPGARLRRLGGALRHPRAHAPRALRAPARADPGRRRRALALLRTARRDVPHRTRRRRRRAPARRSRRAPRSKEDPS